MHFNIFLIIRFPVLNAPELTSSNKREEIVNHFEIQQMSMVETFSLGDTFCIIYFLQNLIVYWKIIKICYVYFKTIIFQIIPEWTLF